MNSDFEYKKTCQHCGKTFIAQKATTKYCSIQCSRHAFKEQCRNKRLEDESTRILESRRLKMAMKEYLSITEASMLLGISRPTLYKMISNRGIKTIRLGRRTVRIKRSDIEDAATEYAPINATISEVKDKKVTLTTRDETMQKFNISMGWFYQKIKIEKITPVIIDGKQYYDNKQINRIFAKETHPEILLWYTAIELAEKHNITKEHVFEYAHDHNIPKKKVGRETLISKEHWDKARDFDPTSNGEFYSINDVTELYNIGRNHLYQVIKMNNVPKIKKGSHIFVHKEEVDNIFKNKKH